MSHLIETGAKIVLKKIRHVETMEEISFVSRFLYQKSAEEVVIEMPAKEGMLVLLEPGEVYQTCFYTSKGLYQCQSQVVSRHYEDSLPVAVLRMRSEFEKLQRRQYYRMECLLQMEFRTVTESECRQILMKNNQAEGGSYGAEKASEIPDASIARFYSGVTLDVSGGGVRFNSEHAAQSGDIIAMHIAFLSEDSQKLQTLFAKVLTVSPVPNHTGLFDHRVEFVSISNTQRECIIRYIFLEERRRRKKESGIG